MRPSSDFSAERSGNLAQSSIIDQLDFIDDIIDEHGHVTASHIMNSGTEVKSPMCADGVKLFEKDGFSSLLTSNSSKTVTQTAGRKEESVSNIRNKDSTCSRPTICQSARNQDCAMKASNSNTSTNAGSLNGYESFTEDRGNTCGKMLRGSASSASGHALVTSLAKAEDSCVEMNGRQAEKLKSTSETARHSDRTVQHENTTTRLRDVGSRTRTNTEVTTATEAAAKPTTATTTTTAAAAAATTGAVYPSVSYTASATDHVTISMSVTRPGTSTSPLAKQTSTTSESGVDDLASAPSFSLSIGSDTSSSGVDLRPRSSVTDIGEDELFTDGNTSQANLSPRADVSMETLTASVQRADLPVTPSKQNGGKDVRSSLPMRISKSLGNFFQRSSRSSSKLADRPGPELANQNPALDTVNSHGKDSKRRTSLASKLMTSLSEWGRRGTSQTKQQPGQDKYEVIQDEEEGDEELFNNNQRKTPLFVSPQEQKEIVEDAPAALSEEQKSILRKSWAVIKNDVADVGVETFMGLFHTHPDAIDSFMAFKDKSVQDIEQSAVLKAHALRVMQTVDKCVTRLDEVDKMATVLSQLGRRHVGYRANVRLVPMIGKQFVSAIEPKVADLWTAEVKEAWESLFRVINYNLRRGMMDEKHFRLAETVEQPKRN